MRPLYPFENIKNEPPKDNSLFVKEAYEASPAIVREGMLLASSLPACLIHGAEESWKDPEGTMGRVVSAVGAGVALGLITRRPRAILKLAAECGLPLARALANDAKAITMIKAGGQLSAHALGTIPFLMEAAQPERIKAVGSAISETWNSNSIDTLHKSRDQIATNWGRFVFDSVAMVPLAKTGDHFGVKTFDRLNRKPYSAQFALAGTFNMEPMRVKEKEPLIDTHYEMVAQANAPHKQPGTKENHTYTEFNETLGRFGEIRSSIGELQKKGSNIDEAKDLWLKAHDLLKTVCAAATSKKNYEAALDQMASMNKKLAAILEGKPREAPAVANRPGMAIRRVDAEAQRVIPKAILDAKLTDVQLKTFETFVKQTRTLEQNLKSLNLPEEEALSLSQSVKDGIKTINALAAESQSPTKRHLLDACLENMDKANVVMDSLANGVFKGREQQAQAVAKLLKTHMSNLDQDLAICFTKASSPKAQLESLALYSNLMEQIALKTLNARDTGHKYETQITKQVQDALAASDDHRVFVPAQSYSPADSTRMDGLFIDLAHNKVMPVDFGLTPNTIAHKLIQSKGLWALHIPKDKTPETLKILKEFEEGTHYIEPLKRAIRYMSADLAATMRHKLDIEQLALLERSCTSTSDLGLLMHAKERFINSHPQNSIARQKLIDNLNSLSTSTNNPHFKQSIVDFLSGTHYEKAIANLSPGGVNLRQAAAFIRDANPKMDSHAFSTFFADNQNSLLYVGKLLGLRADHSGFKPPKFELSQFHSQPGEGTATSLALPQFRFDPLAAAEHSSKLITNYEQFVAKHPDDMLGQYLLKCARDSELNRDSVSQIGSSLAIGLAANKLGAIKGEKKGLGLSFADFKKGTDENGHYISYELSSQARKSVKELALNGLAEQTNAIRLYDDGCVRMVYLANKNGSIGEHFYELGPFEYWNQIASALVSKSGQHAEENLAINSNLDIGKNLMAVVEALETGLLYEKQNLGNIFLRQLQSSGFLKDGKSHVENAPIAAPIKPAEVRTTQARTETELHGQGKVQVAYSTRIPETQINEALSVYQAVKKANPMSIRLTDMRPTPSDAPADRAYNFFSRVMGANYTVFEYTKPYGVDVVIKNGKLTARFRILNESAT